MERKTQNLFIFFEETDDEKDISSKLVRLYMNRFVIDEEDQTEIIGVYNLAKPNANTSFIEYNSGRPFERERLTETESWKENQTKLEHDKSIFESLRSKIKPEFAFLNATAIELEEGLDSISVFNHFIIGSSFYGNSTKPERNFINEIMQDWINENYRSFYVDLVSKYVHDVEAFVHGNAQFDKDSLIKNILEDEFGRLEYDSNVQNLITILWGSHEKLLTAEQVKVAHNVSINELINEDLENFHKVILSSSGYFRLREEFAFKIDDWKCLSFYKQLTDLEVEKLKPEQDEMELQQQKWKTQELRENLLSLLAKSDPGYQYLHCKCQRYTFSMSRENACLKMHNDSFGLNGTSAASATPPKQSRNSEP